MERLRAIAHAHYSAGPDQVKVLAYNFFTKLDSDEDGLVSLHEFLAFMNHDGHTRLANPNLFRELDRDGNGYLDFGEVLTLYYIIKSGRPVCECCWILIPGTFFSCVECFDSPEGSYSLCINCYSLRRSNHYHAGRQQFLDTFTLLQTKKTPTPAHHINQLNEIQLQPRPYQWQLAPALAAQWPPGPAQGSTAIVPASRINRWKAALVALELGLSIGSISTTLCTIL